MTRHLLAWAAILALPLFSISARADDAHTYYSQLREVESDMLELWVAIRNHDLPAFYCRPPFGPLKIVDQSVLTAFKAQADALDAKYNDLRLSLIAFLNDNTTLAGHLMVEGDTPLEAKWWRNSRFEKARQRLFRGWREKWQAFEAVPERDCAPAAPAPAVALPDPMNALVRPVFAPLTIPEIPPSFCSDLARRQWLIDNFNPIYLQAGENAAAAASYRAEVARQSNAHFQADGDPATQQRLDAEQRWADAAYAEQSRWFDLTEETRARILATPIVACDTPPAPALQIGDVDLGQPAYAPVADPVTPGRFCTDAERQAAYAAMRDAARAAWDNYSTAGAKYVEIAKLIGAGKSSPAVQAAFAEADAALGGWYARGQDLDAKAAAILETPLSRCDTPAAEAPKEVGLIPGGERLNDRLRLDAGIAYVRFEGPSQGYLALEGPGDPEPRLGAVQADAEDEAAGFSFAATLDTTAIVPPIRLGGMDAEMRKTSWLAFGVAGYDAEHSFASRTLDPNGDNLGIPGTGDAGAMFPFGVLLGPPNSVTGLAYDYDARNRTLWAKWGQDCWYNEMIVSGFGGLAYTIQDISQRFEGEVPDFLSTFHYDTTLEAQTVSLVLGGRVIVPIREVPGLSLYGFAEGTLNVVEVDGRDALTLNGFISDSQQVDLSDDGTVAGAGLGLGLDYAVTERLGLTGGVTFFTSETHPVVIRDGSSRSRLAFEGQDLWVIQLGVRYEF